MCCLGVVVGMDPGAEGEEQEAAELWQQSVSRLVVICCVRRYLKKRQERRLKFQPRAAYTRRTRSKWGETVKPLIEDGTFAQNFRMSPRLSRSCTVCCAPVSLWQVEVEA